MDRQEVISVAEAAREVSVSVATIRNWMRAGFLERGATGGVTTASLSEVKREMVGRKRLVSRANKQHKPHEVHECSEDEWQQYESSLSEAHRNREGIYYTPDQIVRDMLSPLEGKRLSRKLLLDPCCGSGNFLVEAIRLGFKPENIYGFDLDPMAVKITRRRIKELTGYDSPNIICGDFLELAKGEQRRFDFIFTNPPWGKKMSMKKRSELSRQYLSEVGGGADSSTLFLMASISLLRDGGGLGFLVQEAFFNIKSYEAVRRYLFGYQIDRLTHYGRVFQSLLTHAEAITLTKTEATNRTILCQFEGLRYERTRASFECNPNLILNMWTTPEDAAVIERHMRLPHTTLKGRAQWALGVVTGDNKRYCSESKQEGYVDVLRGEDITPSGVKEASCFIPADLSQYQQVASDEIYYAPEKLIYRFIYSRPLFAYDNQQRLTLNSANIMIPDSSLKCHPRELVKLLNCDFMGWLFREIFHTRKILRRDLESLPLFEDYFTEHAEFKESEYLRFINDAD